MRFIASEIIRAKNTSPQKTNDSPEHAKQQVILSADEIANHDSEEAREATSTYGPQNHKIRRDEPTKNQTKKQRCDVG